MDERAEQKVNINDFKIHFILSDTDSMQFTVKQFAYTDRSPDMLLTVLSMQISSASTACASSLPTHPTTDLPSAASNKTIKTSRKQGSSPQYTPSVAPSFSAKDPSVPANPTSEIIIPFMRLNGLALVKQAVVPHALNASCDTSKHSSNNSSSCGVRSSDDSSRPSRRHTNMHSSDEPNYSTSSAPVHRSAIAANNHSTTVNPADTVDDYSIACDEWVIIMSPALKLGALMDSFNNQQFAYTSYKALLDASKEPTVANTDKVAEVVSSPERKKAEFKPSTILKDVSYYLHVDLTKYIIQFDCYYEHKVVPSMFIFESTPFRMDLESKASHIAQADIGRLDEANTASTGTGDAGDRVNYEYTRVQGGYVTMALDHWTFTSVLLTEPIMVCRQQRVSGPVYLAAISPSDPSETKRWAIDLADRNPYCVPLRPAEVSASLVPTKLYHDVSIEFLTVDVTIDPRTAVYAESLNYLIYTTTLHPNDPFPSLSLTDGLRYWFHGYLQVKSEQFMMHYYVLAPITSSPLDSTKSDSQVNKSEMSNRKLNSGKYNTTETELSLLKLNLFMEHLCISTHVSYFEVKFDELFALHSQGSSPGSSQGANNDCAGARGRSDALDGRYEYTDRNTLYSDERDGWQANDSGIIPGDASEKELYRVPSFKLRDSSCWRTNFYSESYIRVLYIPSFACSLTHKYIQLDHPAFVAESRSCNHHLVSCAPSAPVLHPGDANIIAALSPDDLIQSPLPHNSDRFASFRTPNDCLLWNIEVAIRDSPQEPISIFIRLDLVHALAVAMTESPSPGADNRDSVYGYSGTFDSSDIPSMDPPTSHSPSPEAILDSCVRVHHEEWSGFVHWRHLQDKSTKLSVPLTNSIHQVDIQFIMDRFVFKSWPSESSLAGIVYSLKHLNLQGRLIRDQPCPADTGTNLTQWRSPDKQLEHYRTEEAFYGDPLVEGDDSSNDDTSSNGDESIYDAAAGVFQEVLGPLQTDHLFIELDMGDVYCRTWETPVHQPTVANALAESDKYFAQPTTTSINPCHPQCYADVEKLFADAACLAQSSKVVVSLTSDGEVKKRLDTFDSCGVLRSSVLVDPLSFPHRSGSKRVEPWKQREYNAGRRCGQLWSGKTHGVLPYQRPFHANHLELAPPLTCVPSCEADRALIRYSPRMSAPGPRESEIGGKGHNYEHHQASKFSDDLMLSRKIWGLRVNQVSLYLYRIYVHATHI